MPSTSCKSKQFWYISPHLAGFLTVGIKRHLLGGQLTACVGIVAEVDLPERSSSQQLSLSPVDWRPWCCRNETPDYESPPQ